MSYTVGKEYIRKSDNTRWALVTWGDFSVSLVNTVTGERIYPSHNQLKNDFK